MDPYTVHPTPWSIKYKKYCDEWEDNTLPYIVDANDERVITPGQYVGHPGQYDEVADKIAKLIVDAVNSKPPQG